MAIYLAAGTGVCGSSLTQVGCNDDATDFRSALTISLTKNRVYYILIWAFGSDDLLPGQTAVQLRVTKPVIPTNDLCSGALVIPPSGPFPYLTPSTDILLATSTGDPPSPSCGTDLSASTWYKFVPATTAQYRIITCADLTGTSVADTVMAVYQAPSCNGPFVEVACNDDACGTQAALSAQLIAGTNYYVLVWAFGSIGTLPGGSALSLRIAPISAPSVSSIGVSNITASSARLFGSLNPKEGDAFFAFEWGLTTNYGNVTEIQEVSGSTNSIIAGFTLSG
ncbi:MAG TPA: hypothetical protein VGC95_01330, partial [Chitinophagaceae bacterium]